MNIKRSLLVGATLTTLAAGAGGVGLASAATDTSGSSSTSGTSLVDKLVAKFHLNKADVQAVVDADRQEHEAQREADQKEKLATAVKDGKLTQAQADHITQALAEIKTLRGDAGPSTESDTTRDQIKAKMDALRTWADENNIDMQYVMLGHGHGGPGGPETRKVDDSSSTSSSSTSN